LTIDYDVCLAHLETSSVKQVSDAFSFLFISPCIFFIKDSINIIASRLAVQGRKLSPTTDLLRGAVTTVSSLAHVALLRPKLSSYVAVPRSPGPNRLVELKYGRSQPVDFSLELIMGLIFKKNVKLGFGGFLSREKVSSS
jgi:hypothetical protein